MALKRRSPAQAAALRLLEGRLGELMQVLIDQALAGDRQALVYLLNRAYGPPRPPATHKPDMPDPFDANVSLEEWVAWAREAMEPWQYAYLTTDLLHDLLVKGVTRRRLLFDFGTKEMPNHDPDADDPPTD